MLLVCFRNTERPEKTVLCEVECSYFAERNNKETKYTQTEEKKPMAEYDFPVPFMLFPCVS